MKILGTEKPLVTFVDFDATEESIDFFTSRLETFGFTQESYRYIYDSELCESSENDIVSDVSNFNPNIIVPLGRTATKMILKQEKHGIRMIHGKSYLCKESIIIIPIFNPKYIMRNSENKKLLSLFCDDIKKIIYLSNNEEERLNSVKERELRKNTSKTIVCNDFKEFNEFCKQYIDSYDEVAYDVETNAKEIHSKDYDVVGFSLATTKDIGCYVPLTTLEYKMSDINARLIKKRLTDILKTKNTVVYNCMHEYPATLNWLGFELPKVDDVFVMVKLMMGNAEEYDGNGGLKAQAVQHLNYEDWSDELDTYFDYLKDYKNHKSDMESLLHKYYEDEDEYKNVFEKLENFIYTELPNIKWDKKNMLSYGYVPKNIISRYGSLDSSILIELKDYYTKWMGDLSDELGVNIFEGYHYWMCQHYAGYILELNGAYWNEKLANDLQDWCKEGMLESLKNLIKSPHSENYVKAKLHTEFVSYLRDTYSSEIFGLDFTPKSISKNSMIICCNTQEGEKLLRSMSLLPKVTKKGVVTNQYKIENCHIETIAKPFLKNNQNLFDNFYKNYMDKLLQRDDITIDDLKKFINPNATATDFKDFLSDIFIDENIRIAKTYMELMKLLDAPNFCVELYMDFYDPIKDKFVNYVKKNVYNKEEHKLVLFDFEEYKRNNPNIQYKETQASTLISFMLKLKNSSMQDKDKFNLFKKYLSANFSALNHKALSYTTSKTLTYRLDSLDEEGIIELYQLYVLNGLDIEDKSTWNTRFEFLYNFRRFKKFSKFLIDSLDYCINELGLDEDSFCCPFDP